MIDTNYLDYDSNDGASAESSNEKKSSVKNRKDKRQAHKDVVDEENQQKKAQNQTIKIAEFATASELATLMDIAVTEIVTTCMSLGMMVSMNQRLDAETIQMLVEDFGFQVEFVGADVQESFKAIIDTDEQLEMAKMDMESSIINYKISLSSKVRTISSWEWLAKGKYNIS